MERIPNQPVSTPVHLPLTYYGKEQVYQDDFDFGYMLIQLFTRWKKILGIVIFGTALSIAIALMTTKHYQGVAEFTVANTPDVELFNNISFIKLERQDIFNRLLDKIISTENFKKYALETDLVGKLLPEEEIAGDIEPLVMTFKQSMTLIQPEDERLNALLPKARLGFVSTNERAAVDVVNSYLAFSQKELLTSMESQSMRIKEQRIEQLNKRLTRLREIAKRDRLREIELLEIDINKGVDKLNIEKQLLLELAQKNRVNRMAELSEALVMAKRLNITRPTPIDELSNEGSASTKINVTSSQNLPLFLMGTEYLETLNETLKSREDDALFTPRINEIDMQIEQLRQNPELARLKARENDDLYNDEIYTLQNEIYKLEVLEFDLSTVNLTEVTQYGSITGLAFNSKRAMIAVIGCFLSAFLALLYALIDLSISRSLERQRQLELAKES